MTSAFQAVFGSLFHTTRHSERSEESLNEILRLKPQGATQRICTARKTTLLRAVQIQDRRHTEFCIAFHGCKILKQVQDDSTTDTLGFARILEGVTHLLKNLFPPTRHSEQSEESHNEILRAKALRMTNTNITNYVASHHNHSLTNLFPYSPIPF